MIKKILITLILCSIVFSCGKKGDPVYKASKKKITIENILINKA